MALLIVSTDSLLSQLQLIVAPNQGLRQLIWIANADHLDLDD